MTERSRMAGKERMSGREVFLSLLSIVILIAAQIVAGLLAALAAAVHLPQGVDSIVFGVSYVALAYLSVRFLCVRILKRPMERFRIGKPRVKPVWALCAFLLPALVSLALVCTPGAWFDNRLPPAQIFAVLTAALFQMGLGAGIVEELVFRGVIMRALECRWNRLTAVLLPSMLFGLLHVVGAQLDFASFLLLFVAGTGVGILFSLVVYESGSVWCSALMHGVWNFVMIGRILDIGAARDPGAVFSYQLDSPSFFLTGGDFGVEASAVAVLGYAVFSLYALMRMRDSRKKTSS